MLGVRLRERTTVRRRKQKANLLPARLRCIPDGVHSPQDGIGLHDHAGTTAVGKVVGHFMAIQGVVTQIVNLHRQEPLVLSALEDTVSQRGGDHVRE